MTPRRVLGATVAAVALVLSACSSNGDGSGSDGSRLSAEEFRVKANDTCTELQDDVVGAFADLPPDGDPTLYQGAIAKLVPLVDGAIASLSALKPPAELQARYDEALEAMRAGHEKVRTAGQSPEASATIFAGNTDPYDDANVIFDELGLRQCGSGTPPGQP